VTRKAEIVRPCHDNLTQTEVAVRFRKCAATGRRGRTGDA
jgi:hypothetical protein